MVCWQQKLGATADLNPEVGLTPDRVGREPFWAMGN